jgi:ribonucleoside-diphosphate reductase alpha chain
VLFRSPAGRILAGAGTGFMVTLHNCYVNQPIPDTLAGIMNSVSRVALTLQQGGGIGSDFSTLRPKRAMLSRTGAEASGPLPFMDMFHHTSETVKSTGRRGAMMGVLCDTHPDLPDFIVAKQTKGRLTNFNLSVLISDAFMAAVADDEEWLLYFHCKPGYERSAVLKGADFIDETGTLQYVYSIWKARDLWKLIIRNTYDWSEPGIIFIDRINDLNNLKYCEDIRATNPCGEEPLPPDGACDLGHVNLALMVLDPFCLTASINWSLLADIVKIGVRFLDNVIDVSEYPLPEQKTEQINKRRLGLGVTGEADLLAQLGLRYGSVHAVSTVEEIHKFICIQAYWASVELGKERGVFPAFNREKYLDGTFAGKMLPKDLQEEILSNGLRNGLLLTNAPTGTTSIICGNVSSGIEPNFGHQVDREVVQHDGTSKKEYTTYSYIYLLYGQVIGKEPGTYTLPPHIVDVDDLSVRDHVLTQAAAQRWTDASISKTINMPKNITFEQFSEAYDLAYATGCKGCTTYRPSDVRGSVMQKTGSKEPVVEPLITHVLLERAEALEGITHQIKWPSWSASLYMTVNKTSGGAPFEIFFNSKDARSQEWMIALSLMISAILRKGGDVSFIADELSSVHSINDTAWIKPIGEERPKFFGSLIAYIGYLLGNDFKKFVAKEPVLSSPQEQKVAHQPRTSEKCPKCLAPSYEMKEGCKICSNCGYSTCS